MDCERCVGTGGAGIARVVPAGAGRVAWRSQTHHSWHRLGGFAAPDEVYGRREDAELRQAGGAGIVQAADDEHSSAEPGRVVEPDYGNERRRAWDFRFHSSRSEDAATLFFRVEGGRA